jgi:hypothetical protein
MYPAEMIIVMAIALSGLAILFSGLMTQYTPQGIAGIALYGAAWAYSLYRIAYD